MRKGYLILFFVLVGAQFAVAERKDLPTDSMYRVGGVWASSEGSEVSLSSFSGKPTVIALVYTHCKAICPAIVGTMKRIELKFGKRVNFVLVTLDPERDSPKVLTEFAAVHELKSPPWSLLNGTVAQTRELSVALQLKQSPEADGEFVHTNAFIVLDSQGRFLGSQAGGSDPELTVGLIAPLLAGSSSEESEAVKQ